MHSVLTMKNQVTVPKKIREFLDIGPGERLKFEPMGDGRVAIAPAQPRERRALDPFERMKGSGRAGMTTEELMRATRGADWNK
jgi:AbrB family looped-hinge helix DNA binding protein